MNVFSMNDMHRGWFVGNFEPSVYNTDKFEAGYKFHKKGEPWEIHFHKISTEINFLLEGKMSIQGKQLESGDIFVINPYEIADPVFIEDCHVFTIKVPAASDDKFVIAEAGQTEILLVDVEKETDSTEEVHSLEIDSEQTEEEFLETTDVFKVYYHGDLPNNDGVNIKDQLIHEEGLPPYYPMVIRKAKSDIYGLANIPSMVDFDNAEESAEWCSLCAAHTQEAYDLVASFSDRFSRTGHILEIGVFAQSPGREHMSFTNALIQNRFHGGSKYLGIDLEDKSMIRDEEAGVFFLQENSYNQDAVRDYIKQIGIEQFSLILIDGNHSVEATINDWRYVDLLSPGGMVLIHDANTHPGPILISGSIDRNLFHVTNHFHNTGDWGILSALRVKEVL